MKRTFLLSILAMLVLAAKGVEPLDSIRLSDPCILADSATQMYYMTGKSGLVWN